MSPLTRFLLLVCVLGVCANAWPASQQQQEEVNSEAASLDNERLELIDSGHLQGQVCKEGERLAPGKLPECEPTCKNPNPTCLRIFYSSIDYTPCFCEPPTVRDTISKKCVAKEECPK